ncbi:Ubiquinone biosynthesis O-methyltransferase [Alteromonas sp. 38]|uniref:bifunctional 2-polyprenyl-6-hydroxyphenol methylase/3-demethylubiquinol 3-O-methyltransferase UbiG n=1 Tax=Alteromonas TaxID=226 RepID=UPI0012EFED44|nr:MULTISPECIES: bifunctional 2-polyprenyl-6-hydroxyphenol methylase/3-demethylubiquinol 3-O-methyltransferase UbiG [Alteromonas]CAD5249352.1 Ubiquinone biosynthesis O-methyltransferase [Alteromonas sp. 154]VXC46094.1 Ubiquinone biosynthesis O-methyltransferase [Alteromonas sp. 38]
MLDKSQKSAPINFSQQEIDRFDALAESWWDPNGNYKTALDFNRARLSVIESQITSHFLQSGQAQGFSQNASTANSQTNSIDKTKPFTGLSIVDIGCGGGLISEPLALKGADVTGIDASAMSIEVAKRHAKRSNVKVNYIHGLSSDLVSQDRQFDIVVNAEVVEHVPDQAQLVQECASLVKPGGLLVLATLNRTIKSFIIAIVGAEYVMRYLPIGTHDWQKFVKPTELNQWVGKEFTLSHETGMALNPLTNVWKLTPSLSVNYLQVYLRTL